MYSEAYFEGLEEVLGSGGMEIFSVMMAILVVIYVLALIIGILNYVFTSLALYTVGKRRGLKLYGLGWVPVAQYWLLGSIADQYDRKAKGKDGKLGKFLLIGCIVALAVAIAIIVGFVAVAISVMTAELMGKAATSGLTLAIILTIAYLLMIIWLIVWTVFYYIALFKYYKSCSPNNAVWMLVLSIIIGGLFTSISMLCVRKKDGGFEELKQEEPETEEEPAQIEAPAEDAE